MSGVKIPFTADVRGYNKGLAEMRGKYKEFGDYVQKNKGLLAIGVGAVGFTALYSSLKKTSEHAAKLSAMSKEAKINVEGLQVALLLGKDEGAAQEQVVAALKNLNARTIDAKNGATNYQLALKRLNIDLDTFLNLNTEQKLQEISRGYLQTGEDAQAYRDILTILGEDAGPKMIGVLQRMGTDGFDQLNKKMKESGKILKSDVIGNLAEMDKVRQESETHFNNFVSRSWGNALLFAGFGPSEEVEARRNDVGDLLTGGLFGFADKHAEKAGAEEDRKGRLRKELSEQEKIIQESQKEIDKIMRARAEREGKTFTPEAIKKKETREEQLKRIEQEEKVKQDNKAFIAGIIAEGPKMAREMTKKKQSFQSAVASIPVSSLQAVGGGGTISSSAASQIQVLRSQENLLRMIAENTNSLKESAGPMQKGAPLT